MLVAVIGFTVAALAYRIHTFTEDTVFIERNYYGVLPGEGKPVAGRRARTQSTARSCTARSCTASSTCRRSTAARRPPTTRLLGHRQRAARLRGPAIKVGVIGLGAGSIAVYADADDTYRFYDINPAVIEVAKTWFTYLKDSPGKMETVLGDARLSLEREPPQGLRRARGGCLLRRLDPGHLITSRLLRVPAAPEAPRA
jgi:hypothetical protein